MQATGSLDGSVRIYEAVDIVNLSSWNLLVGISSRVKHTVANTDISCLFQHTFQVDKEVYSICWNPSLFDPPMIFVGTDKTAQVCMCFPCRHCREGMFSIDSLSSSRFGSLTASLTNGSSQLTFRPARMCSTRGQSTMLHGHQAWAGR